MNFQTTSFKLFGVRGDNVEWKKALIQPKILLFLVAAGALLVMGNWVHAPNPAPSSEPATAAVVDTSRDPTKASISDYEKSYEARLTSMLNQMQGVSDASVLVNIETTEEVTYAKGGSISKSSTIVNDNRGATSSTTQTTDNTSIVMYKGPNGDVPVVIEHKKPSISGVWVEAHGVSDPGVRDRIENAIVRVLNIPAHRISITEKQ